MKHLIAEQLNLLLSPSCAQALGCTQREKRQSSAETRSQSAFCAAGSSAFKEEIRINFGLSDYIHLICVKQNINHTRIDLSYWLNLMPSRNVGPVKGTRGPNHSHFSIVELVWLRSPLEAPGHIVRGRQAHLCLSIPLHPHRERGKLLHCLNSHR